MWHWERRRERFFAEYIDKFLTIKMQSSGWPGWCKTEEHKNRYILEVSLKERIELKKEQVEENPGLKSVAKLMLNSFWGKFGMRDNLTQTHFMHKPKEFYKLLRSKVRQVHGIHTVNEECVMVISSAEEEGNTTSNVAIAALTTSYGRLRLLDMMRKLGDRVLYTDTDSVIYVSRSVTGNPNLELPLVSGTTS